MSLVEIKQSLIRMNDEERFEVAKFLRTLWRSDDPEWLAELDRRCDRVQAGHGHGPAELAAIDTRMRAEGR